MGPKKPAAASSKPVKDVQDDGPQVIVSEDREVLYDSSLDPMVEKFEGTQPGFAPPLTAERLDWANDFQRVWSAEQAHDIKRWDTEEARIQSEKEKKELALMTYEESCLIKLQKAIAAHKQATEAELNDEDLLDDGDDGDTTFDFPAAGTPAPLLFNEIFGSAPVIEIEPNSVVKPSVPEGDYVDSPLASGCRVISRLVDRMVANQPYFWEAIYPQTVTATNRRIPTVNPGGKYLVKLFVMGKWRKVEVDDRMPLDDQGKVVVLSSSQPSEIWPTLLAKAIYKVFAWTNTLSTMNHPSTVSQSVGFILNALAGWKSRAYVGLSDLNAAEAIAKNVLLVCSMASIKTRHFNSSCGEAFVMSSIRTSGQSFSINIFTLQPNVPPHDTLSFTSESIEYHKLTTVVLHTIPTYTHQLVQEWSVQVDTTTPDNPQRIQRPYSNALPKFLTVQVPDTVSSTMLYVTLTCAPVAAADDVLHAPSDRGMLLVEKQQLSWPTPPAATINQNAGVLKPNVTWPFEVVGPGTHVYRLYPHDLQNGYSLEVESDVPIFVHPVVDCLRDICHMNVETLDASYDAMAAGTWHVVHRFNMTVTATSGSRNRLYLGLHMYDADASPYFHVHLVHNNTSSATELPSVSARLNLLGGYFDLNPANASESYTVVLECLPCPNVVIPPGVFTITVASDWTIQAPLTQYPVVSSVFSGSYTPNKYLTLFRDVFGPDAGDDDSKAKAGTATSSIHTSLKLSTSVANAAVKLEVLDAATGNLLVKATNYNNTQVMQLPPCVDGGGYIIQGRFDETRWVVPDALRSVQPFSGLIAKPTEAASPDQIGSVVPVPDSATAASPPVPDGGQRQDGTTSWRLEVFGLVPARLTPDCTALNKFAAIKHGWEVAERGREVRGVVSRLLFLGKRQEAMDRMAAAEYSPEQQKEMLARYDFLFRDGASPSITEVGAAEPEVLLGSDFFATESQKLAQDLDAIKVHMEKAAKERAAETAARKLEMDQMKAEMADLRLAMLQEREKLWVKREEIRKQQANPTPPSLFP
ncbi:hypothetical protein DYB30_001505 [Aphanomyces astaci]|uniref:Calpain catalytic domain-containing protein n=1 Tax=Aphanomyces astaci TaxID=112090 RepID=A0A397D3M6_APHAT|nr:hypothetical protein DYB30_001505 [Aphanomyces astaci]